MPNYGAENLKNFLANFGASAKQAQEQAGQADLQKQAQVAALQQLLQGKQEEHKLKSEDTERNIQRAKQLSTEVGGEAGTTTKVGDVSVGEKNFDPSRAASKASTGAKRLADEARKTVGKYEDTFGQLERGHQLLDNPSAINDQKLAVILARQVEGPGQRLLQSVIQKMGADKTTLEGGAQAWANKIMGTAQSGFTDAQRNAIRDSMHQFGQQMGEEYEDNKNKFRAYAAPIGADIPPAQLESAISSSFASPDKYAKKLSSRYETYKSQAQTGTKLGGAEPPQYTQPRSTPQKAVDALMGLFSGGSKPAAQAPAQPQQGLGVSAPMAPGAMDADAKARRREELLRKAAGGQ